MPRLRSLPYYALTALLAVGSVSAEESADPAHPLPADPDAVVLSLDQVGGYEPPRITDVPRIAVLADGRIRLGARYDGEQTLTARLEDGEVRALLSFAIEEQDLFSYDAESVELRMRAEAGLGVDPLPVQDAPETVVEVRLKDRATVVRQRALDLASRLYPTIPELRALKAVADRLETAMAVASLGGPEAAKVAVLDRANAEASANYENLPEETFVLADIRLASASADGSRVYRLSRKACCGYALIDGRVTFPPQGEPIPDVVALE